MATTSNRLLADDEPPAYTIERGEGRSPFLLVCDHASNRIPRKLGDLGVSAADLRRHIAWDVGGAEVARLMSARLDAVLVLQNYSRLVIDANRDPRVPSSIPEMSEITAIPGNRNLTAEDREARVREIFRPYQHCIARVLDERTAAARSTVLVAVHSFTPFYEGWGARPWHIGILYNRDTRLPEVMLELLRAEVGLTVGDNEPYQVSDETDYTIPVHGERRGILHVEVEIRHNEIETAEGQEAWAARLCRFLEHAGERLGIR
jgi:predicted N-formylglutamate amidohydrolase